MTLVGAIIFVLLIPRKSKLKRYKSPGTVQIPGLIQAGGKIFRSEVHKLINSTWNKEGLPEHQNVCIK
jgi:hypothetical protein